MRECSRTDDINSKRHTSDIKKSVKVNPSKLCLERVKNLEYLGRHLWKAVETLQFQTTAPPQKKRRRKIEVNAASSDCSKSDGKVLVVVLVRVTSSYKYNPSKKSKEH